MKLLNVNLLFYNEISTDGRRAYVRVLDRYSLNLWGNGDGPVSDGFEDFTNNCLCVLLLPLAKVPTWPCFSRCKTISKFFETTIQKRYRLYFKWLKYNVINQ